MRSTRTDAAPLVLLALCSSMVLACGAEENAGARIRPHLSPIRLGDIYQRPGGTDPDPSSSTYVPFEWTVLLQAVGTDPVTIHEVCIVGDNHNGNEGDHAFSFEGPDTEEVQAQREAALRITYDHRDANRDLDGDGEPDPDQVALVIQSDAIDYPTLVVPMCARIISTSREPGTIECVSPLDAPPEGEADPSLCSE